LFSEKWGVGLRSEFTLKGGLTLGYEDTTLST